MVWLKIWLEATLSDRKWAICNSICEYNLQSDNEHIVWYQFYLRHPFSYFTNTSLMLFTDTFSLVYHREKWPEITFKTTLIICHVITNPSNNLQCDYKSNVPHIPFIQTEKKTFLKQHLFLTIRFTCSPTRLNNLVFQSVFFNISD